MADLTDRERVVLVTGGSGGIGAAIARRFAADGCRVAVHYNRSAEAAESLADEIRCGGGEAFTVTADVTSAADVRRMADAVADRFGTISVLVNNAGISTPMALGAMGEADISRELGVNVASVVLVTQACLPHMGRGGVIVNVSSNLAYAPLPGMTLYCAAKAAVACLTQGFARELGARGIRVNAVAPGATRTAMTEWIDAAVMQGIAHQTPLGRIAEPNDVAGAVALLASEGAGWVTGRTLIVDGGLA